MTRAFSSLLIFTALLATGQSSARPEQSASRHASLAQIQSPSLRIEFDQKMHSRVVARFGEKEIPLGTFSASESVKSSERSWYDFALSSQTHERVTDNYGAGEKLTLTGTSGVLKKNLSVIIYDEFPVRFLDPLHVGAWIPSEAGRLRESVDDGLAHLVLEQPYAVHVWRCFARGQR